MRIKSAMCLPPSPHVTIRQFGIKGFLLRAESSKLSREENARERNPAMSLLELFCHVDDVWKSFAPQWNQSLLDTGARKRQRPGCLAVSEIMTILIHFHQSHYRDFKAFYTEHVLTNLHSDFPGLVSYGRFVELIPSVLVPLCAYLDACQGRCTGISFVDSTPLAVCHNRRIQQHRVFAGLAERGKNSVD